MEVEVSPTFEKFKATRYGVMTIWSKKFNYNSTHCKFVELNWATSVRDCCIVKEEALPRVCIDWHISLGVSLMSEDC